MAESSLHPLLSGNMCTLLAVRQCSLVWCVVGTFSSGWLGAFFYQWLTSTTLKEIKEWYVHIWSEEDFRCLFLYGTYLKQKALLPSFPLCLSTYALKIPPHTLSPFPSALIADIIHSTLHSNALLFTTTMWFNTIKKKPLLLCIMGLVH